LSWKKNLLFLVQAKSNEIETKMELRTVVIFSTVVLVLCLMSIASVGATSDLAVDFPGRKLNLNVPSLSEMMLITVCAGWVAFVLRIKL